MRHVTKWYSEAIHGEDIPPLQIIVTPKLKLFKTYRVVYFNVDLCMKYPHRTLFMTLLIDITQLLHNEKP